MRSGHRAGGAAAEQVNRDDEGARNPPDIPRKRRARTVGTSTRVTPAFIDAIDHEQCIGCGRCFKVCTRKVLQLRGVDEDGVLLDDDEEDEYERKVMTIARPEHCIGCQACATVCSRRCISHVPLPVAV